MPLTEKIETEVGVLGVWKLSETTSEIVANFTFNEKEKTEFKKITADKRKTEYLATRILLQELLNVKPEISYHKSGKPELVNIQKNISISHSSDFVVVLVSDKNIGIDVENTDRNIKKIANRFLCDDELKHIEKLENPQSVSILYWSAKEAIFKCTDKDGIQFDKQILIHPFEIKKDGVFTGTLNKNIQYKLWYMFYENNVVVYCVELESPSQSSQKGKIKIIK